MLKKDDLCLFGDLWDGDGTLSDGAELLQSGAVATYKNGKEWIVNFEIHQDGSDVLDTTVRILDIISV